MISWECSLDGGEKKSKQNPDRETSQKVATLKKETEGGWKWFYQGANKSLAQPISRCILFDGENISFDASLLYI